MADLKTTYMGLTFRNPILAGSSTQTAHPDRVKALEDAGIGGVVLKSIFEEQIQAESQEMMDALERDMHTEALDYLRGDLPMQVGPRVYLENLEAIKRAAEVPVIASINCVGSTRWVDFGRKVEAAGADAIELNIYDIPDDPDLRGSDIEQRHAAIVSAIKDVVKIPVAVKIGPFYTAPMQFVRTLEASGADAVVLFNRFFQPDINIDTLRVETGMNFSTPKDLLLPLRWTAILRGLVSCDLCLTGGVHDAEGAIKAVLAGANAVQVCSVLYGGEGAGAVGRILRGLEAWMDEKGYATLDAFRGLMREANQDRRRGFSRAQYVKTLAGLE